MKPAAWTILGLCLFPSAILVFLSLGDSGYREVLAKERQIVLLGRSLWVSGIATILALIWGTLVALGVRSLRGFASALLETVSLLPLLLPSIVLVMGWIFFFGANGSVPINIFTEWGTAFVLSMAYYPCVSILLLQGLRSMDPAWAAAASLHLGQWKVFWHVWRPLLTPYAATGSVLAFLLSLSDYGIPSALRINVYPVEIFSQMSAYFDLPRAVAFCMPPFAIAIVLAVARRVFVAPVIETIGHRTRAIESNSRRFWFFLAIPVVLASVALPIFMLVRTQGPWATLPEALTIAGDQALTSLRVSAVASVLLVGAGLIVGLAMKRSRMTMEIVLLLTLIVPGAVVGLGIVVMYTKGWLPTWFYRSSGSMAYGMMCRFILFPSLILAASFGAIRARMMQAASVSGVPLGRAAWKVMMPLVAPGLVAAGIISFIMCLGELSASALINPPGQMTLAVRIASLLHFGEDRIVASLCLTLSVLSIAVLTLGLLLLNRRLEFRVHADRS